MAEKFDSKYDQNLFVTSDDENYVPHVDLCTQQETDKYDSDDNMEEVQPQSDHLMMQWSTAM